MEIILAKTAGFCFGVDRALKKVYDNLDVQPLYTYGPIIHNSQVVADLAARGVSVVGTLEEFEKLPPGTVIIRSHGAGKVEIERLEELGFNIVDATCPYVRKIHRLVDRTPDGKEKLLVLGDPDHAEVRGIIGWSRADTATVSDAASALALDRDMKYHLVAQTTFNTERYAEIVEKMLAAGYDLEIEETICSATGERQKEAAAIAEKADAMIVIGGRHSSNTRKLYEICKARCADTYLVETKEDLELNVLDGNAIIGITAGASTPKYIIEEVISHVRNAK